jgi:acyl-coenzyme A synthetase/AMP-(fatty) acid ligase
MHLGRTLDEYHRAADAFRSELPDRFNFGRDVVDRLAADPERRALLWRDAGGAERTLRFADVRSASNRLAHLVRARGIAPGQPVMVMLPKVPEWHVALTGLLKAAVLVIPNSTLLRPADVAYRAKHSGAVAVIAAAEVAPTVDAVRAECPGLRHFLALAAPGERPPEGWTDLEGALAGQSDTDLDPATRATDPALVYYTSGTTGHPKAVLHTHAYTYTQRYTARFWHGVRGGERIWTTSDTGWAKAAYGVIFGPWSEGAEVVLFHGRFEPRTELDLLMDLAPQVFCAPPTEFRMLVKEDLTGLRVPNLRECVAAGEPLNPEVIRAWKRATGLDIRDGYGQTETILLVANYPGLPLRPGSMGLPMPGTVVDVIDEAGAPAAPGEVGEIAVRRGAPGLFREYWKDAEATAAAWRGDWYQTGDRAYRDEDGYFWFVGRDDDVIISAGYRIGPFEVESALIEHPDVLEAAAIAAPDPDRGAVVKAYVVLREGVVADPSLARRLQDHVKQVTAPWKYPRIIEFASSLPKTVSGKIRRVELRARSASGGS